ncbi:pantetheine-phosphate adenylyltransferase [Deferribacterales bacterium RsTz2092]|nr:phosphopantetheine adenylyltransferase [Deferribacterales bacterium]
MKAIYPGTFDPFTLGHLDIVQRAAPLFSELKIVVFKSNSKHPSFSFEERAEMAALSVACIKNVSVDMCAQLLVDYMRQNGVKYIVRGIRDTIDYEYEKQMVYINRAMYDEFEPVFLMPTDRYAYISSTVIRDVSVMGGDYSMFLPEAVNEYIKAKRGDMNHA